jgi:CheY-like chemotaxis protein
MLTGMAEQAMTQTILVADDQPGQRIILDMLLTLDGYTVVAKEDGKETLEYLKSHTPSLMILDINMPFIDGIEICRRVRAIERLKNVPVIILTASKDDAVVTTAKMAKASAVIHKPLEGKDFRSLVKSLLPD